MSSGSKPKSQILEFFIFHRNGTCICHIDKIDNQDVVINKAINPSSNKESEHRYKLLYGMLFSMKSFVKTLSPIKSADCLRSFSTSNYKLHYAEFINGLRFVCLSTPTSNDYSDELRKIHKLFYTTLIANNMFINTEEQIKNDIFLEQVNNYLAMINQRDY